MPFLTDKERDLLKAQHRNERDRRICDRIKAVLLRDKGWSYQQIADALLLSEDTIRNHINDFQTYQKLNPAGGGSNEKLSTEQSKELEDHLQEHTYLNVKSIAAHVEFAYGVVYTIDGLTKWLKKHGFSYKKPKLIPGKANLEQQLQWIEEYSKFKSELPDDETICFIDGVHPTHNPQLGYGWIKKGIDKEIPANTGRARINLTGAIDVLSHDIVVQEDKTLNAEATIRFFDRLEQSYPDKARIHLFCDNAPYYRNKNVTKHLETSRIELHFLPPYSPNLNPIERLWKWMKEVVIYNIYYPDFSEFRAAIFGFFRGLSGLDPGSAFGRSFRHRIRDKFRAVGAPSQATV